MTTLLAGDALLCASTEKMWLIFHADLADLADFLIILIPIFCGKKK
jgi:hypothetical protein